MEGYKKYRYVLLPGAFTVGVGGEIMKEDVVFWSKQ